MPFALLRLHLYVLTIYCAVPFPFLSFFTATFFKILHNLKKMVFTQNGFFEFIFLHFSFLYLSTRKLKNITQENNHHRQNITPYKNFTFSFPIQTAAQSKGISKAIRAYLGPERKPQLAPPSLLLKKVNDLLVYNLKIYF